jgi:hypothetical protein
MGTDEPPAQSFGAEARAAAESYVDADLTWTEMMSTYEEFDELLSSDLKGDEFQEVWEDIWKRNIALDKRSTEEFEQQWMLWCSRNMNPLDDLYE